MDHHPDDDVRDLNVLIDEVPNRNVNQDDIVNIDTNTTRETIIMSRVRSARKGHQLRYERTVLLFLSNVFCCDAFNIHIMNIFLCSLIISEIHKILFLNLKKCP